MDTMGTVLDEMLDRDLITTQLIELIEEIIQGKHKLNEPIGPGYNVRDLRSCNGFWLLRPLIDDMAGAFIGRICRAIMIEAKVDMKTIPLPKLMEMVASTDTAQEQIVNMAIPKLAEKFGTIELDPSEKTLLLTKVRNSQASVQAMMTR